MAAVACLGGANSVIGADIRITGTYTNLRYIQESGDLLGLEMLIVPASDQGSYIAFVQMAEGGAPYSVVVPLTVIGSKVQFSMPNSGAYAGLSFSGVVAKDSLVGAWSSGQKEVLKRHASYWN